MAVERIDDRVGCDDGSALCDLDAFVDVDTRILAAEDVLAGGANMYAESSASRTGTAALVVTRGACSRRNRPRAAAASSADPTRLISSRRSKR